MKSIPRIEGTKGARYVTCRGFFQCVSFKRIKSPAAEDPCKALQVGSKSCICQSFSGEDLTLN